MFNLFNLFAKDESSNWEKGFNISLVLNLQTETLNNIRIGDLYENLRIFGRPDNKQPFKKERFIYSQLGLDIEGSNGKIEAFILVPNKPFFAGSKKEFAHCEFTLVTRNSRQISINKQTNLKGIEYIFGVSPEKEIYEGIDIIDASYRQGNLLLEFEFSSDGTIRELSVEKWFEEDDN